MKKIPTQERVMELLDYNPLTGIFIRKVGRRGIAKEGSEAGNKRPTGYRRIKIDDVEYLSHRIAWLYVYGKLPDKQLDHINGVRDDNRISNLREVTTSENGQNQRRAQSDNKIGLLGVSMLNGKWRASIMAKGIKYYLGTYETPQIAHEVYLQAKRKLHPTSTI